MDDDIAAEARSAATRKPGPGVPSRPFRARAPWYGGDLQTMRNMIVRPRIDFDDAPAIHLHFPMADGTGDALSGHLHRPPIATSRPLVLLIHGLTGDADSYYLRITARHLLDRGYPVLRLNLRGAGETATRCREQYHAGRTADLRRVLELSADEARGNGMFAVGYSLGGNMLLRLLGEGGWGPIRAAASISAPIALAEACRHIESTRNSIYHRYFLRRMKAEARASRGGLPPEVEAAAARARSIFEYDDTVVAPRYGFASAPDYYARSSALSILPAITVPTLILHARNDPWIPPDAYERAATLANPALRIVVSDGGGHVGFHGRGSSLPWSDLILEKFFASTGC